MDVPLDESFASLRCCMGRIITWLKLVCFAAGHHRSCVSSACRMLKRSLLAPHSCMSMLFAASNILSFDPSNLDVVHRLAFAKHYVGGALKYWCKAWSWSNGCFVISVVNYRRLRSTLGWPGFGAMDDVSLCILRQLVHSDYWCQPPIKSVIKQMRCLRQCAFAKMHFWLTLACYENLE